MSQKMPREVRIEALLTAAVEEFLQKGYNGASIDAIAKRAGVSKGGFYHHFPNKDVLLMEANRKLSEPVERMAEAAFMAESALEGLSAYIKGYLHYWADHPREMSFLFLSMSKAFETGVLMDYYKEYVEASTSFFTEMFQKAVISGELEIDDPEAYGITLMGALDGVISYLIVRPEEDVDRLAKRLERIWLGSRGRNGT